ncbi:MAG TPA: ABC transporter permease [Verrucomicrobiae bacterium]|nr:ABC transporter permease [Verrucomicrobiae bacterium]
MFSYLRQLFSSLFHRAQLDADLDEELRAHIARHADDLQRSGLPRSEAERQARIAFGSPGKAKEQCREQLPAFWLETLYADIRFGLRMLRKNPTFTTTAILTLALGIGANTAIFQLLDAIRLRTLPVQDPQQLAEIRIIGGNNGLGINEQYGQLTRPLWQALREHQQSFSDVLAWGVNQRYIGQGADMRRFKGLWVTGNFFQILGVQPWRGRLLLPEDASSCPITHALVSYGYWQNVLGGRDLSEGIKFVADGDLVEVVGVTPPKFFGVVVGDYFDIALPFCVPPGGLQRNLFDVSVMGRLKPHSTVSSASAELAALSPGLFEATAPPGYGPDDTKTYKNFRLAVYPAAVGVSELRQYDRSLYLLLGITGLVLLIACANLANLMLARASARQSEIAVRLALGATRARVIRQLLLESALLAAVGAAIGVGLAQVLGRLLIREISTQENHVSLVLVADWCVLLFVSTATVLTCIVFGTAPALRATSTQPLDAMKSGGRVSAGHDRLTFQQFMTVTQIAISLVLLVGALLFVRSFRNLMTMDPGMRERGVTAAFLGFWQSHIPKERWLEFRHELLQQVQAVPGVLSAANTTNVPLSGQSWSHSVQVGSHQDPSKFTWVSADYFTTMGIPIRQGRAFSPEDTASSPRVAVVNATFVRNFFGDANPIGQTLRTIAEPDYPSTVYQIVGVIPDTRYSALREPIPPMAFAPATQCPSPGPWTAVMIHSNIPTATVAAAAKARLKEKYPDVLAEFFDFQAGIQDSLIEERLMATFSGFFGVLAALLTMIGVYGVISYLVAARRNEIGIRMALGATRLNVVSLFLRQALLALALGILIGTLLALVATRGAATLLYGLHPNDPLTFIVAIALLIFIALLGSLLAARRAATIDPMIALRYE